MRRRNVFGYHRIRPAAAFLFLVSAFFIMNFCVLSSALAVSAPAGGNIIYFVQNALDEGVVAAAKAGNLDKYLATEPPGKELEELASYLEKHDNHEAAEKVRKVLVQRREAKRQVVLIIVVLMMALSI